MILFDIFDKLFRRKRLEERLKVPRTVQQAIPVKAIYEDGLFEVSRNKYSKTYKFTDVNYAVAGQEDKEHMFLNYGAILNLLDSGSYPKLTIINRKLNKVDFDSKMKLDIGNDRLSKYRKEYNNIMANNSIDSNGIIQEKLLTIAVDKKNVDETRNYFSRTSTELSNNFAKLGSKFTELDTNERLRIFYDFFRVGEEDIFKFDIKKFMRKGHNFKDYICPDSFGFKSDYFMMGNRYGRVLFLKEYASYIRDNIISELTDLDKNMMLSIDIKPVPMEEAIKKAEKVRLGVETNIAQWQRRQNENNNFYAIKDEKILKFDSKGNILHESKSKLPIDDISNYISYKDTLYLIVRINNKIYLLNYEADEKYAVDVLVNELT